MLKGHAKLSNGPTRCRCKYDRVLNAHVTYACGLWQDCRWVQLFTWLHTNHPKEIGQRTNKIETRLKSSSKAAFDLRKRDQTRPPSESQNPEDKRYKYKGKTLFLGKKPSLSGILACSVACVTSMVERISPTSHLIARGGQVPARTTLNGEGVQPQLNNSTPMLVEMTSNS